MPLLQRIHGACVHGVSYRTDASVAVMVIWPASQWRQWSRDILTCWRMAIEIYRNVTNSFPSADNV